MKMSVILHSLSPLHAPLHQMEWDRLNILLSDERNFPFIFRMLPCVLSCCPSLSSEGIPSSGTRPFELVRDPLVRSVFPLMVDLIELCSLEPNIMEPRLNERPNDPWRLVPQSVGAVFGIFIHLLWAIKCQVRRCWLPCQTQQDTYCPIFPQPPPMVRYIPWVPSLVRSIAVLSRRYAWCVTRIVLTAEH